ncbi:MAG: helix-turn-helix domain-containing protein [Oscillospiraceae bacterium]|nr:helix-turn-helix domain-containing protein [Oscillospiraceae bacterium]
MSKSANNDKMDRQVYTVDEIKQILGIGRTSAYELMKNPPFRVIRVGRTILIPKDSFHKWFLGE